MEAKTKTKKVDLKKLPKVVTIVALKNKYLVEGKEYKVTKETAIILINKKAAKLK